MGEIYSCSNCDYTTESKRGLSIHQAQHKDKIWKTLECSECNEKFERRTKDINRDDRESENFFCSTYCKDTFEAKDGLDAECSECGSEIHIPPSQTDEVDGYEQNNYFCDKNCESSFKSREWVGEEHPSWKGGKDSQTCDECGEEYLVKRSKAEDRKYCSEDCGYDASRKEIERECENCGDLVKRIPSNMKSKNVTCSKKCLSKFLSSIRKGKQNPQWKGGRFTYYGPNWNEQREKTLEQDKYECQECGMNREKHYEKYSEDLHVHHKVKRREIIDEDEPKMEQFEVANSLDNLITLCKSCHRKME